MNLGGQSQNFPFSFFHSSAPGPPAGDRLPVSGGGLGVAKPPPDRQPARALSMAKPIALASSHVQASGPSSTSHSKVEPGHGLNFSLKI